MIRVVSVAAGAAALVVGLLAGRAEAQSVPPRFELDAPALAERIVERLRLRPGEAVLLLARPGVHEALVPPLRYAVMRAGGVDLGTLDVLAEPVPESWSPEVLGPALRAARNAYRAMLRDVDAAILLPGTTPAHPAYAALQDGLREGRGRTIHFHWLENGSAFALPGQPLPPRHVIESVYERAVLDTDYEALAERQRRFAEALRRGTVRITSPLGTDLRFRVGDRPVNLQDGDASAERAARAVILIDREIELPAGAVRVAPLEETVEGVVAFPPSQWDERPVEGLMLRFEAGRVVEVRARSGQDAVEAEMRRAGEAGRSFRELALGLNPLLAVPERRPWIPYYGYGAGVVRLSLGDNTELGGAVGGGYVRWNFFTDATVVVGEETWVRDGRLVR